MHHVFQRAVVWSLFLSVSTLSIAGAQSAQSSWTAYRSNKLSVKVSVPSNWTARISSNAIAFRTGTTDAGFAAIGIMKSVGDSDIESQATKQYQAEGQPADWDQILTNVAGMPAIKILSTSQRNPSIRVLQYYVSTPNGSYIIQCMAPKSAWSRYQQIFSSTVLKLQFLA
jgi:hypothetical protein